MKQKYSAVLEKIDGRIEYRYSGKVSMLEGLNSPPIMRNINDSFFTPKREELGKILEQHEEEFDKNPKLIKLKINFVESINNKSRLRNWLSKTWEDIRVYTGLH